MKGLISCKQSFGFLSCLACVLLFGLLSTHSASATSISRASALMSFYYTDYNDINVTQHWVRYSDQGTFNLPYTLVAYNPNRAQTTVVGLGVTFTPANQASGKYYNKYRFGITLRQDTSDGAMVSTIQRYLGTYQISMDATTNTGVNVHTENCGYEIGDDFISHICYIDLDNYQYLTSASFNLGNLAQTSSLPYVGLVSHDYVFQVAGNTNAMRLTDLTDVRQASDDPLLSGQQTLIQNTSVINSNIVAFSEQNHEDLQTLNSSVRSLSQQQHDDYVSEVEREEDKQAELEDQADDLSISAQNPGNPFANLFQTNGCVSMPVFSGWFHRSDVIEVCSPYPQEVRPIIEFVSSVIVVGFLIKIYFKLFKGGYAS